MAEVRQRQMSSMPGIEYGEIFIPDDSDMGTGTFTTLLKPNALYAGKPIISIMLNKPEFQISVNINPGTREIPVLLGKSDGSDPIAHKLFLLPRDLDISVSHEFVATFENWKVTDLQLDGKSLSLDNPELSEIIGQKDLIEKWKLLADSDRPRGWNGIQLMASLRLICHFFGKDWYRDNISRRINAEKGIEDTHPLNDAFWSGKPEDYVRILHLGISLKVLQFDNPARDLLAKLPDLSRSDSSFEKTYFELKTAATYASAGFQVQFLRERKGKKTPDLRVIRASEQTYIECKKRDPSSQNDISSLVNGVLDRLREANAQFKGMGEPGIAFVEVEDDLNYQHPHFHQYSRYISDELALLSKIQCVVLSSLNILSKENITQIRTVARGLLNGHIVPTVTRELWCNPSRIGTAFPRFIIDLPGAPPRTHT